MGYYTNLEVAVKIKPKEVDNFKEEVFKLRAEADKDGLHWFNYYYDIWINKDRSIKFDDYERKFYFHEKFADWLAKFVEEGYIYCKGEVPSDIWCIYFDGVGNWKEMQALVLYYDINADKYTAKKQLIEQINKLFD